MNWFLHRFKNLGVFINGDKKYSGIIEFDNKIIIQVDIIFASKQEWYTSIIYFTGSKNHNIKLRTIAKLNGYKLNEHGLFKNNIKIEINSEKELYKILNINYLDPINRD